LDGNVRLLLTLDGDLQVMRNDLYVHGTNNSVPLAVWHTDTANKGYLVRFLNGALTLYDRSGHSIWVNKNPQSNFTGTKLVVQNDGNVVALDASNNPTWSLGTAHREQLEGATSLLPNETLMLGGSKSTRSGRFQLRLSTKGVLSIYNTISAKTVWSSPQYSKITSAKMLPDGRLALLSGNNVSWGQPATGSVAASFVALREDGNLGVYDSSKFEVWAAGTTPNGRAAVGTFTPRFDPRPLMMWNGESLKSTDSPLSSASRKAKLTMQTSGDLVYTVNGQTRWAASWEPGFISGGTKATLTVGGNLQITNDAGTVVYYSSNTDFYMNAFLSFDDNGRISINRVVSVGASGLGLGAGASGVGFRY
jgi:hypothetical protein